MPLSQSLKDFAITYSRDLIFYILCINNILILFCSIITKKLNSKPKTSNRIHGFLKELTLKISLCLLRTEEIREMRLSFEICKRPLSLSPFHQILLDIGSGQKSVSHQILGIIGHVKETLEQIPSREVSHK